MNARFYLLLSAFFLGCFTASGQVDTARTNSLLREVYNSDQGVRIKLLEFYNSGQTDSMIYYSQKMARVDSENREIVFGILDSEGWPSGISDSASKAIYLVVDHAPHEYQKKYFSLMQKKTEEGVLDMSSFVTFADRVLMGENEPQVCGTQTVAFGGKTYMWPIRDAGQVDTRRAEVGLPSISYYLEVMKSYGSEVLWDREMTVEELLEMRKKSRDGENN